MSEGFVVLPDTEAGTRIRGSLATHGSVLTHASGRPWLVGEWQPDQVRTAAAGPARVAVLGHTPLTDDEVARLAARITRLSDVDGLAASTLGSCHVAVSVGGRVRFQGSVSGLRRVCHTRINDVTVASDRSDLLADLTGAEVDEEALALRVACGLRVPYPANARSTWSGVRTLPPESFLCWDGDRARDVAWWQPPEPIRSLGEGAAEVRRTLADVLARRPPAVGRVSADLSGGLDSTSLSFLAARDTPNLLTFRWGEAEEGNDDAAYAERAWRHLDRAEHLVVPQHELPEIFAHPESSSVSAEEPVSLTRATARIRHNARLLAERGARRHLAGHGGDELFAPTPTYLQQLLRRHPVTGLRHVRAFCALRRWPVSSTLAELSRPAKLAAAGTFASWWRAEADRLTEPEPSRRGPALGWGLGPLRAAPWTTGKGVDLAREALLDAAEQARPLSDDLGTHTLLLMVRSNTASYRLLARLYAESGVELDMPYLDDAVVEAVLRVPAHERGGPWRYKPLLAEAMRDVVPEEIRTRSTKGEFGEDVRRGLRNNLPAIWRMFDDSELAERGLIDPAVLRARLAGPQADNTAVQSLENLLGCETWLRAATARRADGLGTGPGTGPGTSPGAPSTSPTDRPATSEV
jgi:asparagine synthase (glutamine-hydrolysing)